MASGCPSTWPRLGVVMELFIHKRREEKNKVTNLQEEIQKKKNLEERDHSFSTGGDEDNRRGGRNRKTASGFLTELLA